MISAVSLLNLHLVSRYFPEQAFKLVCIVFCSHWFGVGKKRGSLVMEDTDIESSICFTDKSQMLRRRNIV